jgi:cell division protein FtsW (lipid II flippase)
MQHIIVQISKYLLLALMVVATFTSLGSVRGSERSVRKRHANVLMTVQIIFAILAFLILYLQSRDERMFLILGGLLAYSVLIQLLYRVLYKQKGSMTLLSGMCMLLTVGFVIQARLGISTAIKQMIIVAGSSLICLIIPVIIHRVKTMRNLGWLYATLGILLLGAVFVFGRLSYGANLSVTIGGISFQFSEFVKITFVFFIAAMLKDNTSFRRVVLVSVLAAMHVGILVLSRDLGAALIYFVAYIVMVSVATKKLRYALLGVGGMAAASVAAYRLFSHVRVRVQVWRNPFADYEGTGYQIVQALFGVCAGGWFGTGLFEGNPEMIPLAKEDFTYAAICEEFGILFGICLIFLCMSMYLQIVSISTKLSNRFYRLVSIGLGTEYAFQVFLTIGGTTKFIPMTGITLPLVSYGGSSIMCTIIMLSIIQGLFMIREEEEGDRERLQELIREQNEREERKLRIKSSAGGGTRMLRTPRRSKGEGRTSKGNTRWASSEESGISSRGAVNRAELNELRVTGPGRQTAGAGSERRVTASGRQTAGAGNERRVTAPGRQVADETSSRKATAPGRRPDDTEGSALSAGKKPREGLTEALEQYREDNSAEPKEIDIENLAGKIEDETERSLNY